jgi:hypothetical protein
MRVLPAVPFRSLAVWVASILDRRADACLLQAVR